MIRFRSVTTSAIVAAIRRVARPMKAACQRPSADLEERVEAGDQVDAGGHHRRGADQGGDRCGALHRIGEPGVEQDMRGFGDGPEQQQADRGHDAPGWCGMCRAG